MSQCIQSKPSSGFSLVEIVIGCAIILTGILTLTSTFGNMVKIDNSSNKKVQAQLLLDEGFEVIKILRDTSWSSSIASTTNGALYYANFDGNTWNISTTSTQIDGIFTRTIKFSPAYRDVNHNIASSGTLDLQTKIVDVEVSYPNSSGGASLKDKTFITNIFNN